MLAVPAWLKSYFWGPIALTATIKLPRSTAQRMIRDVVSGQVFVNTYGASGGVELPFGGFRQSGFGREKGAEGLRGFAQLKTAVIAS